MIFKGTNLINYNHNVIDPTSKECIAILNGLAIFFLHSPLPFAYLCPLAWRVAASSTRDWFWLFFGLFCAIIEFLLVSMKHRYQKCRCRIYNPHIWRGYTSDIRSYGRIYWNCVDGWAGGQLEGSEGSLRGSKGGLVVEAETKSKRTEERKKTLTVG